MLQLFNLYLSKMDYKELNNTGSCMTQFNPYNKDESCILHHKVDDYITTYDEESNDILNERRMYLNRHMYCNLFVHFILLVISVCIIIFLHQWGFIVISVLMIIALFGIYRFNRLILYPLLLSNLIIIPILIILVAGYCISYNNNVWCAITILTFLYYLYSLAWLTFFVIIIPGTLTCLDKSTSIKNICKCLCC